MNRTLKNMHNRLNAIHLAGLVFLACTFCGCNSLVAKNEAALASYYSSKGEHAKALEYFEKSLEKSPNNEAVLIQAGWAYFNLNQYDQAIATFEKLAEAHPKVVDAYTGRGWIYFKQLDYDQAMQYFAQALDVDKNSADAYAGLGWASFRKGEIENAERFFENSLRKGARYQEPGTIKTEPEAHRGLGYLNFGRENYEKAALHFKIACLWRPDWNDARLKWGDSLFQLKKYKEAMKQYKRALRYAKTAEIYDKAAWSCVYLAEECHEGFAKKKYEAQAQDMFDKALTLDPEYQSALAGRARLIG